LTGLSPVALCRNVNKLRYFYRENYSSLLNFKMFFNTIEYSFWRNQKCY
jgi:hypothetical protein